MGQNIEISDKLKVGFFLLYSKNLDLWDIFRAKNRILYIYQFITEKLVIIDSQCSDMNESE